MKLFLPIKIKNKKTLRLAGQKANKSKSEIFVSPIMLGWQREVIARILGIKIVDKHMGKGGLGPRDRLGLF